MKIREMTATFGRLEKASLRPGEGLTLIEAPNEGGKSTWAAFLRAMFYGFPTRDRDKAGYLAEKNRYQPWSGAAMEGTITLLWQGRELTLYRGPKGNVPWGAFQAVWAATGETVDGLTGDNCGQILLGVSREVFERTAFVGQGEIALSPSADLEKRVAALATSGQEDVSFSQVERRLKDWLNRRRSNRVTGLIPDLEGELAQICQQLEQQESLLRQAQEAAQEREQLAAEKAELERALQEQSAAARDRQNQRRAQAQAELEQAQADCEAALRSARALPQREELRRAQGDLSYLNTLSANLKLAEKELPKARQAAQQARAEVEQDACFAGEDPAQAAARAQSDAERVERLQKKGNPLLSALGTAVGVVLGTVAARLMQGREFSLPILILGALLGSALVALPLLVMGKSQKKRAEKLLEQYAVGNGQEIRARAAAYSRKVDAAREAERTLQAVEGERDKLMAQREELTAQLLEFVHLFAPEVHDLFGVSAALSRALQQGESQMLARTRLEAAEKLLSALPAPEAGMLSPTEGAAGELAARLVAVERELAGAIDASARLQGELNSRGDRGELEERRDTLTEELECRREEYDAIAAALEGLRTADSLLRERFSPAVNQRAGAYLSQLSGGRYEQAALTREFQALARQAGEGVLRQDLSLSGGAARQLYLAVRLAMCELVLPEEDPNPILLDDVLDCFDDTRAELALQCFLEMAKKRQILLFSCHSREGKMLAGTGAVVLKQPGEERP